MIAAPAAAQERDLCPDRPGLGTPACTVEPGRVLVEIGLADWTTSSAASERSDTILFGDTLVRFGVSDRAEALIGWTPLGYSRERIGGVVDRATRSGDVTLGAKLNLASPDGSGFSFAIQPQVSLPVGRAPIGAGDWGATLIAPVSYDLSDTIQLQATPEVDAAVDADGDGRHLAFGTVIGLGIDLSDAVGAAVEVQAIRDRDPGGRSTQAFGAASLAWTRGKDLQLDVGAKFGLSHASDDFELYAGVSRRF